MKTSIAKIAALIGVAMTILNAPTALGGTRDGCGTFVRSPLSKTLVFWDLYLENPRFSEDTPGDQISLRGSSRVAMEGRIDARPLVKNGDANISAPLKMYSSHVRPCGIAKINASAITPRARSLAKPLVLLACNCSDW